MLSNRKRRRSTLALELVGLLFLGACSDPFQVSDSLGEWGGEGVAAMIETGSASFEFDCAHASIPGGLSFREDGSFEVSGIWVREGWTAQQSRSPGRARGRLPREDRRCVDEPGGGHHPERRDGGSVPAPARSGSHPAQVPLRDIRLARFACGRQNRGWGLAGHLRCSHSQRSGLRLAKKRRDASGDHSAPVCHRRGQTAGFVHGRHLWVGGRPGKSPGHDRVPSQIPANGAELDRAADHGQGRRCRTDNDASKLRPSRVAAAHREKKQADDERHYTSVHS